MFAAALALGAAEGTKRDFDIPAGKAEDTLRRFAEQSAEQFIFSSENVSGVSTKAVKGSFSSMQALEKMLAGTSLVPLRDEKSGSLGVKQKSSESKPAAQPAPKAEAANSSGQGTIIGQVSNQATGIFLEGAIIRLEGTALSTTSERGGGFSLTAPSGEHVLVVSYTGLDTARIKVNVEAGTMTMELVKLNSDVYKLEPFVVTSLREGNAAAIQRQRQADNVKMVVATDAFGNAAANPGELLQRLPGVAVDIMGGEATTYYVRGLDSTFSSITMDGNQMSTSVGTSASRMVNIQQIGTQNIESVELIKAATPDMDANGIGGTVNVVTKRAFDRAPGRLIDLTVGTRWTKFKSGDTVAKDTAGLDLVTLNISDVYSIFGNKNNLGVALSFSNRISPLLADEAGAANNASNSANSYIRPSATNGLTTPLMRMFGSGAVFSPKTTNTTVGLNIDYKHSASTYIFFKNSFNRVAAPSGSSGYGYTRAQIYVPTNAAMGTTFAPGSTYERQEVLPVAGSTIGLLSTVFMRKTLTYNGSTGFEHKFIESDAKLSVNANYSLARSWYPLVSGVYSNMTGFGWVLDRTKGPDAYHPVLTQTSGPSIYDPANYTMTTSYRQSYNAPLEQMSLRADFQKNFDVGVPAYIKTGVKMSNYRFDQSNIITYKTWRGPKGVGPYVLPPHTEGDGMYGPFPYQVLPYTGQPGDPTLDSQNWYTTAAQAYTGTQVNTANLATLNERTSAAYIMGNVKFQKLRVLSGVRVERTDVTSTGWPRVNNSSTTSIPTLTPEENAARAQAGFKAQHSAKSNYQNLFPGIHFVYEPANRLLVRASYNYTISRPPGANLLSANGTINPETQTISLGNPDLKPYTSDNFDLAVQKYFEPVGSFEVGVFLKQIHDYIRTVTTIVPSGPDNGFGGDYAGFSRSQPINTGGARIRGIEFTYTQQYSFLPGFWRGFGSFANFTYLSAEGDFGGTTYQKTLSNQRPRTANGGITYRGHGLDARVLANWQDTTYYGGAAQSQVFYDPLIQIDVKLQYQLNRRFRVYLDIMNITDENFVGKVLVGGYKISSQRQGTLFAAGVTSRF